MTKVVILQSNYIPWKGYFDLINAADIFIFHDDLQYTKDDWRNRNKIKTQHGLEWLTIPCGRNEHRRIDEVQLTDHAWQKKHWCKILENYRAAPFFNNYKHILDLFYLEKKWTSLSELNQFIIIYITRNILKNERTQFLNSNDFNLKEKKMLRVIELLKKINADEYISGPSAKDYIEEDIFKENNIKLTWFDYSGYPEYEQLFGTFIHYVSILDTIFNCGANINKFIKIVK